MFINGNTDETDLADNRRFIFFTKIYKEIRVKSAKSVSSAFPLSEI